MVRCRALRVAAAAVAAVLAAAGAADRRLCAAQEPDGVLVYEVAEQGRTPAMLRDVVGLAVDVLTKRCRHAGFEGVSATPAERAGRLAVKVPAALAASRAALRHLVERPGSVRFRVRADEATEDEWRDRRLQAGVAPPEGCAWVAVQGSPSMALVETPEVALESRLSALAAQQNADLDKSSKEYEEREKATREAFAAFRKKCAESVPTNLDIATATVQRSISTWGAKTSLRIAVRFALREERKAAFEKLTGDHVGRELCVVVDGVVVASPRIATAIPGEAELTGPGSGFTEDEARELAAILECGPLPRLVAVEEK